MRIFVKYNRQGEILSVSKIDLMPENIDQPYMLLDKDESVLEVSEDGEYAQLDALQLHEGYKVDLGQKTLVPKA